MSDFTIDTKHVNGTLVSKLHLMHHVYATWDWEDLTPTTSEIATEPREIEKKILETVKDVLPEQREQLTEILARRRNLFANNFNKAVDVLKNAKRITFFTGAGISAESGIQTYRGADDSYWNKHDPAVLSSLEGFIKHPDICWPWYLSRMSEICYAEPNAAHHAITEFSKIAPNVSVITQNIDDLHERAGNSNIMHLHGQFMKVKCLDECGFYGTMHDVVPGEGGLQYCPACKSLARPDVVWFGEMLPTGTFYDAEQAANTADVMISIGTSSCVYPAAAIPIKARNIHNVPAISINLLPGDHPDYDSIRLTGKAGVILPMLLDAVKQTQ